VPYLLILCTEELEQRPHLAGRELQVEGTAHELLELTRRHGLPFEAFKAQRGGVRGVILFGTASSEQKTR
jgi:hypothetical protein